MPRIAVLQMTTGIDPAANAQAIVDAARKAAAGDARMLFTPEMSGLLDRDRARSADRITAEADDPTLGAARVAAKAAGIWIALGSIAVRRGDGRLANRSVLISETGEIAARYDKIHMFDVDLASGESWRESNAYAPGEQVVTAQTPLGLMGLTICYDIRFPALYEELGRQLCDVITIPAAFTVPTGSAHWHIMQRARAIEASAFVIAAAQTGTHEDGRQTYGHSLVIDPWGEVLLDMGREQGLGFADIDLGRIEEVRRQLPSLANRRNVPRSGA